MAKSKRKRKAELKTKKQEKNFFIISFVAAIAIMAILYFMSRGL